MGASMGVLQWPERVTATMTTPTIGLVDPAELAAGLAVFFEAATGGTLGQSKG